MAYSKPIHVVQHNHLDSLWQRCWNRTFDYMGKRYRSYADIQEHIINLFLENAKHGTAFTEGQSVVFRKYIERNPERLDEIRELVQNGQIELLMSGEIVCDTNMPSGETLLRNLVLGQQYFIDTFGVMSVIGSLEDAFGQSAQMPQLFRGVGCKMIANLSRKRVPGKYWKGLDGSVVFIGGIFPAHYVGHWWKVPPCSACDGMGCEECGGRGLADAAGLADEDIWREMTADYGDAPFGVFILGGEEAVPNTRLPEMMERARKELNLDIRNGLLAKTLEYCADDITRIDDKDIEVSDQVESNYIYTGCYVSRIKIKQELRRIENLVNTAERWATIAHILGTDYPYTDLLAAWRHTSFLAFHDAVTGTHLKQPYFELLDMIADVDSRMNDVIDNSLTAIEQRIKAEEDKQYIVLYNSESWERNDPITVIANTQGIPKLTSSPNDEIDILDISAEGSNVAFTFRASTPALGYSVLEITPDTAPINSGIISTGPGEVENEYYKIQVNDRGIESIFDKRSGSMLASNDYLINEMLLEEDKGDFWGTMQAPPPAVRLSKYTTSIKIRRAKNVSEIILTGQYKGDDSGVDILTWRQSMTLYMGYDRIDFHTQIDWDTQRRRIRLAFPTGIKTDSAHYSIPYGALKRDKYETEYNTDYGTNGDIPAVNWIDVYDGGKDFGVALLNTGTPSHKVEDGVIFLSVLRSPADLWSVSEEDYDYCLDFDDGRDQGLHNFYYSLIPHQGNYIAASIEKRGREVNNPLICRNLNGPANGNLGLAHSFIEFDAPDNIIITAVKKAEKDDSVIVRMAETAGIAGEVSIKVDGAGHVAETVNFLELDPEPISGKITLEPFKIVTVRLKNTR